MPNYHHDVSCDAYRLGENRAIFVLQVMGSVFFSVIVIVVVMWSASHGITKATTFERECRQAGGTIVTIDNRNYWGEKRPKDVCSHE